MNLNISEISTGRQYESTVSGVAFASKKELVQQNTELLQMKDTVSTSSWARIASGALRHMKEDAQMFRPDRVEKFKFLAQETANGKPALSSDEMADSIFSRMFG